MPSLIRIFFCYLACAGNNTFVLAVPATTRRARRSGVLARNG
jgi:hypothetical protein